MVGLAVCQHTELLLTNNAPRAALFARCLFGPRALPLICCALKHAYERDRRAGRGAKTSASLAAEWASAFFVGIPRPLHHAQALPLAMNWAKIVLVRGLNMKSMLFAICRFAVCATQLNGVATALRPNAIRTILFGGWRLGAGRASLRLRCRGVSAMRGYPGCRRVLLSLLFQKYVNHAFFRNCTRVENVKGPIVLRT